MGADMASINWSALVTAFEAADAAWLANAPLPAPAPFSSEGLAAALAAARPEIDKIAAVVQAHPGAIAAADIMLAALAAQDVAWAAPFKALVDALPGGLATAQAKLPTIIWLLTSLSPAPGWRDGGTGYLPGPDPFAR